MSLPRQGEIEKLAFVHDATLTPAEATLSAAFSDFQSLDPGRTSPATKETKQPSLS
ncbi:MAG: hypothetical protein ACR2NZ_20865 [Rubripirellula sp.]